MRDYSSDATMSACIPRSRRAAGLRVVVAAIPISLTFPPCLHPSIHLSNRRPMPMFTELPLVSRARATPDKAALVDAAGEHTYAELLDASAAVAAALLEGAADLGEVRVCFMVPPSFEHAAVQWGIWRAGGIAVPLAVSHPPAELEYAIGDADAAIVVAAPQFAEVLRPLAG